MVFPYGKEHWCNLEGQYMHIVADLSHLMVAEYNYEYEMSICTLGIYGTRYARDQNIPSSVQITKGDSMVLTVPKIYSTESIGTQLLINLRSSQSFVTFTENEFSKDVYIDTTELEGGSEIDLILESFNSLSIAQSTLKSDTVTVIVTNDEILS